MAKKQSNYINYIIDSMTIIHLLSKEWNVDENVIFLIPSDIGEEMKSFESKAMLELLQEDNKVRFIDPTPTSIEKIKQIAEKTGDISKLSTYDVKILALAYDFPEAIIISDDKAIQNVSEAALMKIKAPFFRISTQRTYFWRCSVCGEKYNKSRKICIECGSPVKRFYVKTKEYKQE